MQEISTLENDIKGIKEAIDAKNAPMMVCDYLTLQIKIIT